MIPIQALINWVLNYGDGQEKKMAREAEAALENVHKQLLEYRNHIARLQAIEAAAQEVLAAHEPDGIYGDGMQGWTHTDERKRDAKLNALAAALDASPQPGDAKG
jgi:hypothetical protein